MDRGREEAGTGPPPLAAESVVGAVFSVLRARLLEGGRGGLLALVNPLMSMIVLPYLGGAAARRELAQPAPRASSSSRRVEDNPLKALQMRLTYRTMCVLSAVAANPACSNRRVAQAAGIGDQGQISKLLARLEKFGLIENATPGKAARGEPNAWKLTAQGKHVHGALAAQGGA